jgi:hypothetical protein
MAGGVADLWFAMSPTWSLQLGVEVDARGFADPDPAVTATFGIGRLFEMH